MGKLTIWEGIKMEYKKRTSEIQSSVELGFQDYDVDVVTKDDSAFLAATLSLSGFYPEHIRLLNDSEVDALIKINEKEAFTLPAGDIMSIGFDNIFKVEVKSKEAAKTTIVEVMVLGRTDINM